MTQNILVIGATGLLGKPVTHALINAGFNISVMARDEVLAKREFPMANVLKGDLKNLSDIENAMQGQDAVYLSLSAKQTEKESEFHAEQEGLDNAIQIAKKLNIKRLAYLSSIVHQYQGMNDFDWWAFRIKRDAVAKIKSSGIPYSIFYPSTFMESIFYQSKQGSRIALGGKSEVPLWYIAADDYGKQVVNSFKILNDENRDYFVQGLEAFTQDQAAKIFIENYPKEKLSTMYAPMWVMKLMGVFSQKFNYGYYIVEALNKYPETFKSQNTWDELGKPTITLKEFAKKRYN
jgi:uncharacterized protein YbjT (DUF2867 family)